AIAVRIVEALEAKLEVVRARLLGQVVRELRLHLWFLAQRAERVPAGAGYRSGRAENDGWIRCRIDLHRHRPIQRKVANVDVEEGTVRGAPLPLPFLHRD